MYFVNGIRFCENVGIEFTRKASRKGDEGGGAYTNESKDTKNFPKKEIRSPNREGPQENWNLYIYIYIYIYIYLLVGESIYRMSNTFLLSARSSQSHVASCASLMSHHQHNN